MDELEAIERAKLCVVQHGTRASFRRRVVDAMLRVVGARAGFFCLGTDDRRAYADSTRCAGGVATPLSNAEGVALTRAFGFELERIVATTRRVHEADELHPPGARDALPYFADHSVPEGLTRAVLVFLHEGGVLFGLAGLERTPEDGPFTEAEVRALEALAPFVVAGARAQLAYDELSREAAALRAISRMSGTLFVVDREQKRVVWAANREHGIDWGADVEPVEEHVVRAAERALATRAKQGEALPTPPRLPSGAIVGVATLEGDPVFGSGRCAVLRVEPQDEAAPLEGLSRREREIARLLVAGYSGVNVAAISGLSENTVRTYVRRLYTKLGVANRADLVRKLMAPADARFVAPSRLGPPADSALGERDDTLD